MFIKIQGADQNKLVKGNALTFAELQTTVDTILADKDSDCFADVFCSKTGYSEMPYSEGYADYLIDLDEKRLFVTRHTFPKKLCGASVLYFTENGSFEPVYHAGGEIADRVYYLAICKEDDNAYSVYCINEKLEVAADGCLNSFEDCKKFMDESCVVWHEHKYR